MSYIFPKRLLRANDVLDPVEMNEDIIPAAELYSGKLNEHNFESGSFTDVEEGAHYTFDSYVDGKNNGFGTPGAYTAPNSGTSSGEEIPRDGAWYSLSRSNVTVTTGNAVLWIVGWAQYHRLGWDATFSAKHVSADTSAGVQFALRVGGRLLEWTVTGRGSVYDQSPHAYRSLEQRTGGAASFGPAVEMDGAAGCGPELMPVRVGTMHPVEPGTYTIELLARRLLDRDPSEVQHTDDVLHVLGRRLFALQMPTHAPTTSTLSTVSVNAFEAEDSLSESTISALRLEKIKDALNNIKTGALARAALNRNHLSSPVIHKTQVTLTPTTVQVGDNLYPGYGSNTTTTSPSGGSEGWYLLDDGAGTDLEVTGASGGNFDMSTNSIIIILANVQLRKVVYYDSKAATPEDPDRSDPIAAFTLMYTDASSGTQTVLNSGEAFTNHHIWWHETAHADAEADDHIDIPLFAILDNSSGSFSDISKIGVFGSTLLWNYGLLPVSDVGAPLSKYSWKRGSLIAIQVKV